MPSAQPMTDHDQIRQWAEERGARPACVKGTGGRADVGMIRLDFPGFSGEESLQEISWDEWFKQFDENNLALIVQQQGRGKNNFNKLVSRSSSRGSGAGRSGARNGNRRSRPASGGGGGRRGSTKRTQGQGGRKRAAGARKSSGGRKTSGRSAGQGGTGRGAGSRGSTTARGGRGASTRRSSGGRGRSAAKKR